MMMLFKVKEEIIAKLSVEKTSLEAREAELKK